MLWFVVNVQFYTLQCNTLKEKFVSLGKSTWKPWVSLCGTGVDCRSMDRWKTASPKAFWILLWDVGDIVVGSGDAVVQCSWFCRKGKGLLLSFRDEKGSLSSSSVDIINDKTYPEERSKSVVLYQRGLANFRKGPWEEDKLFKMTQSKHWNKPKLKQFTIRFHLCTLTSTNTKNTSKAF